MGNVIAKNTSDDAVLVEHQSRKDHVVQGSVISVSKETCSVAGTVPDGNSLSSDENDSLVSSISDPSLLRDSSVVAAPFSLSSGDLRCKVWDKKTLYSDFIQNGLQYLGKKSGNVIMLYESPSSSSTETSFFNNQTFPVHDYPAFPAPYKTVLAPLRYSIMNGSTYPSFLAGAPPKGLMEHWERRVPNFRRPVLWTNFPMTLLCMPTFRWKTSSST
jgi:hypothetical protein